MIIQEKILKKHYNIEREYRMFDFTTFNEDIWNLMFSKMKKYLPYKELKKPFLAETCYYNGVPSVELWFVVTDERIQESSILFEPFACYIPGENWQYIECPEMSKIWQAYLKSNFGAIYEAALNRHSQQDNIVK